MQKFWKGAVCIAAVCTLVGGCGNNKTNPVGPNGTVHAFGMIQLAGGTFLMGSNCAVPDAYLERPVHSVALSSFWMDTTEVTQNDYYSLMQVNPSRFANDPMRPVEGVTWYDAVLYCNARSKRDQKDTVYSYQSKTMDSIWCIGLDSVKTDFARNGYRLPTEAEWEFACKAGDTFDYYWGRSYPLQMAADTAAMDSNSVWLHNATSTTALVATKKPNAWGLYDMSGNVCEWCNDNWDMSNNYTDSAATDPAGPETGWVRIIRGSSINDYYSYGDPDYYQRSSIRRSDTPDDKYNHYHGLRCVRR
jgi:formylglycine-generating enzyme required for sulfatase activity